MNKSLVTLTVLIAATLGAAAQNTTEMKKDTVQTTMQNIENGVVKGYTAIQDGVVEGFTRVSDSFIMKFFAKKGETIEQAKERMKVEEAKLHQESEDRTAASRQHGRESVERARKVGKQTIVNN